MYLIGLESVGYQQSYISENVVDKNRLLGPFHKTKLARFADISWLFLTKQLLHSCLLDMRCSRPTLSRASRWFSLISCRTHTRGIIVKYNMAAIVKFGH